MAEDFDDFRRKADHRASERAQERRERQEQQEKRYAEQSIDRRETNQENNRARRDMLRERLSRQERLVHEKRETDLVTAEVKTEGSLEVEKMRSQTALQTAQMNAQAKIWATQAEQNFYPRKLALDLDDDKERSKLRAQEYMQMKDIDRQFDRYISRSEHRQQLQIIIANTRADLVLATHDHQQNMELEKVQHLQGLESGEAQHLQKLELEQVLHLNKKDYETHRINEQIFLFRAIAEMKREFGQEMAEEVIQAVAEIYSPGNSPDYAGSLNEAIKRAEGNTPPAES